MPKLHDHAPEFLHHLTPESMPGAPHDSWYCLEPPQRCATVPFALREGSDCRESGAETLPHPATATESDRAHKTRLSGRMPFPWSVEAYVNTTDLLTNVNAKNKNSHQPTKKTRNK